MKKRYEHLNAEERATIMVMKGQSASVRTIARMLGRCCSTVSREVQRNTTEDCVYSARRAGDRARELRGMQRRRTKLSTDSVLFDVVRHYLWEGWSPEQIAGTLKRVFADDSSKTVSHETIYNAIYVMPRGELRAELIACLRQGKNSRRPRSGGVDRRGQIPDMARLSERPSEADDRLTPGHWEGDLIKGAGNKSAVGTLVERSSRLVMLAKVTDGSASAALEGFSNALNRVHDPMKKTLAYDRGKEMSCHKQLTQATGVKVYFADPHSPWQRGSNENTNGLLRQYLPKGTELGVFDQEDLNAIAFKLNTRPRKIHGFKTPLEIYAELLIKAQNQTDTINHSTVALET
jgi:transposase, IS30 family